MMSMRCQNIEDIVSEVRRIIDFEKRLNPEDGAEFFFRGEVCNHATNSNDEIPTSFDCSLDRNESQIRHERDLYEEAMRYSVASFEWDRTMTERVARMQHYGLPTRFADLSISALQATYFGCGGGDSNANRFVHLDGFIRIFKIASHKMKSFTSDIIVALSHLPLVDADKIHPGQPGGLDKLRYEVTKERPSFGLEKDWPEEAKRLHHDIEYVWAFKPILNNRRISYQEGIFLAFGCHADKKALHPSFSPADYNNSHAPSYGIEQIGVVRLASERKKEILDQLRIFGVLGEMVYPELEQSCKSITSRICKNGESNVLAK